VKDHTGRWLRKAEDHLASADLLYREGHYSQSIFLDEQAIECLLKALWLEGHAKGVPPKVHDLVDLAEQVSVDFDETQLTFLRRLQDQYMPTRYADVEVEYDQETAQFYRERSRGMFEWLRPKIE